MGDINWEDIEKETVAKPIPKAEPKGLKPKSGPKIEDINISASNFPSDTPAQSGPSSTVKSESSKINWDEINKNITSKPVASTPEELHAIGVTPDSINQSAEQDFKWYTYLGKSFGAGLSFEIFPNELETKSLPLKVAGWSMNVLGTLVTGALLSTGISELGLTTSLAAKTAKAAKGVNAAKKFFLAEKALQAVGESTPEAVSVAKKALWGARKTSLAATALKSAAEGMYMGLGVGAARSAVRGDSLEDAIVNSITESLQFAAGGVILSPVAEGFGAFQGRKIFGKVQQGLEQTVKNEETMNLVKKVKELKPFLSYSEILTNEKALKDLNSESVKNLAISMFKGPEAPAAAIYQSNSNLKTLVDQGHYAEALDMLPQTMIKDLKANPDLMAAIQAPILNDAASIAKAKAATFMGSKGKFAAMPNLEKLLVNYFEAPTQQLEGEILSQLSTKGSKAIQKFNNFKNNNVKLNATSVENLVYDNLQKALNQLSGASAHLDLYLGIPGKTTAGLSELSFSAKQLGKLKQVDETINALVTLNEPLGKSIFHAANRGMLMDDNFGLVKDPADLDIVKQLKNKKINEFDLAAKTKKLFDINQALRVTKDPVEISTLRDARAVLLKDARRLTGVIRGIDNAFKGAVDPEKLTQLQKQVNEIFIPSKESLSAKAAGAEISKNNLEGRFFDRDNPVYLKKNGDLANQMHALAIAGYNPENLNKLSLDNVQRKINKELGFFNPIQRLIFEPYKKAMININAELDSFGQKLKSLGVREGSDLSAKIQKYGEGRMSQDEWVSLPAADRDVITNANNQIRGWYNQLFDRINGKLKENNFPEVKRIEGTAYFHHFSDELTSLKERLGKFLSGTVDPEEFKMGKKVTFEENPTRPFMGASLRRSGGEFTDDAIGGFKRYVQQALKTIHYTDLMRQTDSVSLFAPQALDDFLYDFKMHYLVGKPAASDEKFSSFTKGVLNTYRRRSSNATLLGNISTAFMQLTSAPLNFGVSAKAGLKALLQMGQKDMQEIVAQSTNLALRDIQTEGFEFSPSVFKTIFKSDKLTSASDKIKKMMGIGLQVFDRAVAKHAYLTGYNKATAMGLGKSEAIKFADYWVGAVQGDMSKIGQPEFMNSVIGRSFAQFQSFSINLFSSLWNDLPLYAQSDGPAKAISIIMKTYAGITLTNEVLKESGLPPAFEETSFLPFISSARYGVPGAIGAGLDLARWALARKNGNKLETALTKNTLEDIGLRILGIPGSVQAKKTFQYLTSDKEIAKTPYKKSLAFIHGKGIKYKWQEREDELRKVKNSPFRRKVKNAIFGPQ